MTYYLHVESPEPMAGSDKHVYFFDHKINMQDPEEVTQFVMPFLQGALRDLPAHPVGRYVILQRCCKHRWLREARSVISAELLKRLQLNAYDWRQRDIFLLGQYRALVIYPNKYLYWRELLRKVLAHPDKYPPLTSVDKVLFALTWHKAELFWATPVQDADGEIRTPLTAHFDSPTRPHTMTRTVPMPKHAVPPDPRICYTTAHFNALWRKTVKEALPK